MVEVTAMLFAAYGLFGSCPLLLLLLMKPVLEVVRSARMTAVSGMKVPESLEFEFRFDSRSLMVHQGQSRLQCYRSHPHYYHLKEISVSVPF
jgi:hypothetical protein